MASGLSGVSSTETVLNMEMKMLDGAIGRLEDKMKMLQVRLQPVICNRSSNPEKPGPTPPKAAMSQMASALNTFQGRINDMVSGTEMLIGDLEV